MNGRIEWVDTARGIGLLLVILGHLKFPYLSSWIYTFHMPLFFFISGLLYSDKGTFLQFVNKKFQRLVIPYFVLGAVIYLFWTFLYYIEGRPGIDYFRMLQDFLVQKHFWTVWFLAALFFTEIIYWLINHICKDNLIYSSIVSSVLCALTFVFYRLGGTTLPWDIDVALVAQFFYHLGYVSKKRIVPAFDETINNRHVLAWIA